MKKIILILFILFLTIISMGQGTMGADSWKRPEADDPIFYELTSSSVSIECTRTITGGAASWYKVWFGTTNPPALYLDATLLKTGSFFQTALISESGLSSGTTYYYKFCFYNSTDSVCKGVYSFTTPSTGSLPSVTTSAATNVTSDGARLNGNVTSDGGSTVNDRGFYFGDASPPTTQISVSSGTGTYYYDKTGLTSDMTYYFRAYAVNDVGEVLGDIYSFTTSSSGTVPEVETTVATGITTGSANTGGEVISENGSTVTSRGICYGTSANPTTQNQTGSGLGVFYYTMSYLSANTTYYYRAYATNAYGTSYGTEYSLTTLPLSYAPTVVTNAVTDITHNSATLNGNVTNQGSSSVTVRGFVYSSTDSNPFIGKAGCSTITSGSGTGVFSGGISSLSANTLYYVKAFATNTQGNGYGSVVTFTTDDYVSCPSVVATSGNYTTGEDFDVSHQALIAGDMLVIHIASRNLTESLSVDGWTELYSQQTATMNASVYYKIFNSYQAAGFTTVNGTAVAQKTAQMIHYRNVRGINSYGASQTSTSAFNSAVITGLAGYSCGIHYGSLILYNYQFATFTYGSGWGNGQSGGTTAAGGWGYSKQRYTYPSDGSSTSSTWNFTSTYFSNVNFSIY